MSSEGAQSPIEHRIVPMVFAFNCLRVCPPYWSCHGHRFPTGELFRVPQVWFYSKSMVYPKLIGDLLIRMKIDGAIQYPWHICIAYTDQVLESGFSIEPDTKSIEKPDVDRLQRDAASISGNLVNGMKSLAQTYIAKHEPAAGQPPQ